MRSILRYKPYFLLAVELDAEWSRARLDQNDKTTSNLDPIANLRKRVTSLCNQYRSDFEQLSEQYSAKSGSPKTSALAHYLYNPIFCLPSGHADGLAFILVDDFDAVHHIASHSRVIEDMVMGFCPEAASLGIEGHPYVCDIEEHWTPDMLSVSILTRIKLDGVCSLEFGLLFKRAVFRAVAARCKLCIEYFRHQHKLEPDYKDPPFKISLLALQGQEEIGILCSTINVTLAVALSSAIRSINLPDLFPPDDTSEEILLLRRLLGGVSFKREGGNNYNVGQLHQSLLGPGASDNELPKYSVFRWSKSILGFRFDCSIEQPRLATPMTGSVSLDLDFQFIPGAKVDTSQFTDIPASYTKIPDNWRFAEVGSFDFRHTIGSQKATLPVFEAANHVLSCVASVVKCNNSLGRIGIVGIRSVFSVPIPDEWPFSSNDPIPEAPLDERLYKVRKFIDLPKALSTFMSIEALLLVPSKYGMPRALRRSIESLFRNFLTAVSNPNLYDLVIDLYDAFSTLHRVLVQLLPQFLIDNNSRTFILDPELSNKLSRFANSLRNALERRLFLAYPDSTVRNVSLQFPGSLAQILLAADAPLKAALGVLKYHLPKSPSEREIAEDKELRHLHHIGMVADITLEPGIRADNLLLETTHASNSRQKARLSYLSLDVDHLFYVGSYFDYIHEAFHLVFDEMCTIGDPATGGDVARRLKAETNLTRVRIEETFVQLASFIFCAPDRPRELLHYLIGKYSQDIQNSHGDDKVRTQVFAERTVRMIIPCWLVYTFLQISEPSSTASVWLEQIHDFFAEQLQALLILFPETANVSRAEQEIIKTACLAHLRVFWNEAQLSFYLPRIWHLASNLYTTLCSEHPGFSIQHRKQHASVLQKLQEGWALTRIGHGYDDYVNSVAGTALILGQYLTRHGLMALEKPNIRFQLDREGEFASVTFRDCIYAEYLIDRGSAQRFCFDADARGRRLQNQIAIIESFWDFSSHFRARRVTDLLLRFGVA